tara:strand:- start:470 stop:592 length:123 start_codon:yes stop_codon:yes gene_type:complete
LLTIDENSFEKDDIELDLENGSISVDKKYIFIFNLLYLIV